MDTSALTLGGENLALLYSDNNATSSTELNVPDLVFGRFDNVRVTPDCGRRNQRRLALSVLRVAGQVIVAVASPRWLPPMREWYSGLLPYQILLPVQIVFVLVMLRVTLDTGR